MVFCWCNRFKWPFHMEDVRCDIEEAIYAAKETSRETTLLSSFKQSRAGKWYILNVLSLNSKLIAMHATCGDAEFVSSIFKKVQNSNPFVLIWLFRHLHSMTGVGTVQISQIFKSRSAYNTAIRKFERVTEMCCWWYLVNFL